MVFTTALLADHPEHLPTAAEWLYREWASRRPGSSPAQVAERLQSHLGRDRLPLMVLALAGPECVGCASVRTADLESRADLTPWLASVYVPPTRRRLGIGARLVRAAEAEAARLGVARLYLFTPDRQRFYAALGWTAHEHTVHAGEPVTVMCKQLDGSLPAAV